MRFVRSTVVCEPPCAAASRCSRGCSRGRSRRTQPIIPNRSGYVFIGRCHTGAAAPTGSRANVVPRFRSQAPAAQDVQWRLRHPQQQVYGPNTVLSGLLVASSIAAGVPILAAWEQGLGNTTVNASDVYSHALRRLTAALQSHLLPVLLVNVLVTWARLLSSGVAALVVPVRYTVTSSSNTLDCLFHVPFISPEAADSALASRVCRLAALQVGPIPCMRAWATHHLDRASQLASTCAVVSRVAHQVLGSYPVLV